MTVVHLCYYGVGSKQLDDDNDEVSNEALNKLAFILTATVANFQLYVLFLIELLFTVTIYT